MTLLIEVGRSFRPGFANQDPWLHMLFIEWPISLAPALFTYFLPRVLGYRRGGMAWVGFLFSLAFTILLPLQMLFEPWGDWYPRVHPWLFGVFYAYAAGGLALCAVGLYDRKESAFWGLLAVASLLAGALVDTAIWFGLAAGVPAVPYGFIGFWIFLAVAYLRREADPPAQPDLREAAEPLTHNRTRRSRSQPRKLLREGNLHLLPLYYLLNLSDLGREGIANSGSFRFADHIYVGKPSGRTQLGVWLDRRFLALPAAQAFRRRYLKAQGEIQRALEAFPPEVEPLRLLAVPCGIPRDLAELAARLEREAPDLLRRLAYTGMDLDPELLAVAREFSRGLPLRALDFHLGNALLAEQYPPGPFHAVVSTGLGEFLSTTDLRRFYRNVHEILAPGGTFYTSATRKEGRSDALMRAFELITQYRSVDELDTILSELPWSRLTLVTDETGLQTFARAVK
ncbi:MAG: methyltransferase [Thermoanaerobaculia bacterium]